MTEKHPARLNLLVPNNIYMSTANTIIRPIGTILLLKDIFVWHLTREKRKYRNKGYREKKEYPLKRTHKAKVIRQVGLR